MPLAFPSHQGLLAPLWRRWPEGLAVLPLWVGAFVLDPIDGLAHQLVRGGLGQGFGHSLLGAVVVDVPVGLLLLACAAWRRGWAGLQGLQAGITYKGALRGTQVGRNQAALREVHDMTTSPTPYRPAMRGLVFGLVAMGFRAAAMGISLLIASQEAPPGSNLSSSLDAALPLLPAMNLAATLVALVGVGYSAIAAHRKEWGAILVLAFVFSVAAAVLDIQPFVYAVF